MFKTGDMAPGFTLTADDGSQVSLADFKGQKVVLYFYPKADTPGCTTQACSIRDAYGQIEAEGAAVIGISPDPPEKLVEFRQKYDLPFVLLSDPDHAVAEAYGAWGEKKMYGKVYEGILRSHFGIDAEGRIADFEVKVKPLQTVDFVLTLVHP